MAAVPRGSTRLLQRLFARYNLGVPACGMKLASPRYTEKIVIPNRIPRSSTSILEALASTVSRDISGPHYKYHDDPYLTPASNLSKRSYSLSKEAGRKAARWIRDKHFYLFKHTPEDPVIEGFYPKISFTEESDVSESTLRELIHQCQVADAIQVYQICKKKQVELSDSIRQELMEFVGYYNSEEALDQDWVEERWYRQGIMSRDRIKNTWKDHGLAEELFQSLSEKTPEAYCALIRGMTRYYQVDRAWQLFQEMLEKNIALDTETYNSLLRVASILREGSDLRWKLVKELLSNMAEAGVSPNLGTMNSTLESLSQMAGWRQSRGLSLQVLAEFSRLGIQPSLASYYYLLIIHCRERGPTSHILVDIMNHLEGKEFELQDPKDSFFFVTAMDVCRNHLQSKELARRVDDLLHTGINYKMIGDSYKESIYYRHYFALSCSTGTVDEFMQLYEELVPHVYTPEPGVMEELINAVKVHEALEYLPQLWSDMIVFDHTGREKLLTAVLSAMSLHKPSADNAQLGGQLATIAWDLWTRVKEVNEGQRNKITWTGQMIGDLLTTLVSCGEYNKGVDLMQEIISQPHTVLGSASSTSLRTLLDAAIQRQDENTAVETSEPNASEGNPQQEFSPTDGVVRTEDSMPAYHTLDRNVVENEQKQSHQEHEPKAGLQESTEAGNEEGIVEGNGELQDYDNDEAYEEAPEEYYEEEEGEEEDYTEEGETVASKASEEVREEVNEGENHETVKESAKEEVPKEGKKDKADDNKTTKTDTACEDTKEEGNETIEKKEEGKETSNDDGDSTSSNNPTDKAQYDTKPLEKTDNDNKANTDQETCSKESNDTKKTEVQSEPTPSQTKASEMTKPEVQSESNESQAKAIEMIKPEVQSELTESQAKTTDITETKIQSESIESQSKTKDITKTEILSESTESQAKTTNITKTEMQSESTTSQAKATDITKTEVQSESTTSQAKTTEITKTEMQSESTTSQAKTTDITKTEMPSESTTSQAKTTDITKTKVEAESTTSQAKTTNITKTEMPSESTTSQAKTTEITKPGDEKKTESRLTPATSPTKTEEFVRNLEWK